MTNSVLGLLLADSSQGTRVALIVIFVAGLLIAILAPFVVDLVSTYSAWKSVTARLIEKDQPIDKIPRPEGIQGLARTTMAFGIIVSVGFALVYIVVEKPFSDNKTMVTNVLVALTTAFAAVAAFYFGSRTATDASAAAAGSAKAVEPGDLKVTITTPAEGAKFLLGENVAPAYTCIPSSGAGITSIQADDVDTTSAGAKTFTVRATDSAGKAAQATIHYTVG